MITATGWFDWMAPVPGPAWKRRHDAQGRPLRNGLLGEVGHSAEGWRGGLRDVLFGPRAASWTWSTYRAGTPEQHYSVLDQVFTTGAIFPNANFITTEAEGIAGQPLNAHQRAIFVRASLDLAEFTGRRRFERIGNRTSVPDGVLALVEHGEATRWGAPATSCPSGRYDWGQITAELLPPPPPAPAEEGDEMYILHRHRLKENPHLAYLVQGTTARHIPNNARLDGLKKAGRSGRIPYIMPETEEDWQLIMETLTVVK